MKAQGFSEDLLSSFKESTVTKGRKFRVGCLWHNGGSKALVRILPVDCSVFYFCFQRAVFRFSNVHGAGMKEAKRRKSKVKAEGQDVRWRGRGPGIDPDLPPCCLKMTPLPPFRTVHSNGLVLRPPVRNPREMNIHKLLPPSFVFACESYISTLVSLHFRFNHFLVITSLFMTQVFIFCYFFLSNETIVFSFQLLYQNIHIGNYSFTIREKMVSYYIRKSFF